MSRLILCDHCRRHVRHTELVCPFCSGPHTAEMTRAARAAALLLLGVGLAAACADDNSRSVPVYGAPPMGGTSGADAGEDAGDV